MFFDELDLALNPNAKHKGPKPPFVAKVLTFPKIINIPYVEFTDAELEAAFGEELELDTEIYPNYCLVAFKHAKSGRVVTFELAPQWGMYPNLAKLNWIVHHFQIYTFNGKKFDDGILFAFLAGCNNQELKYISDKLIIKEKKKKKKGEEEEEEKEVKPYRISDACREFGFEVAKYNHVDLFELTALRPGLKTLAGRLHAERMQDLPYDPATELTFEQAVDVRHYCVNDLDITAMVKEQTRTDIVSRVQLSQEYDLDLRSYSDAQIAEQVLTSEVTKALGYRPRRPVIAPGTVYRYDAPAFIGFQTPMLRQIFEDILASDFVISKKGQPKNEYLKGLKIRIGDTVYTMGVGGLHSNEKCTAHRAVDGYKLIDRDVASYYPRIILNNGFFPKHLTAIFLEVYDGIVERRLKAKKLSKSSDLGIASLNKIIQEALKITINGSFGKLGSKYSNLYSPDLLIQVTLTGQLALLMLIEALELAGIKVVSANTDGIVIKPHTSQCGHLDAIVASWEKHTGFETEETNYKALLSCNVNNYIALKEDDPKWTEETPDKDKWKGKGLFGEASRKKQPTAEICAIAISKFLLYGTPVAETITSSRKIADFIVVKNVKGGAEKDGLFLGKAIRWYYGTESHGTINYILNGNTVGGSDGGKPCMDLPKDFPTDINYDWYINACEDMLADLGFYGKQEKVKSSLFDNMEEENW